MTSYRPSDAAVPGGTTDEAMGLRVLRLIQPGLQLRRLGQADLNGDPLSGETLGRDSRSSADSSHNPAPLDPQVVAWNHRDGRTEGWRSRGGHPVS